MYTCICKYVVARSKVYCVSLLYVPLCSCHVMTHTASISCRYQISQIASNNTSSTKSAVSAVEFQEALKGAIMMNVYNKRAAASAHLCGAWGQAVDVSVYGFGSRLLPGESEN